MAERVERNPTLDDLCGAYSTHYESARSELREARLAIERLSNLMIPVLDDRAFAIHQRLRRERDELQQALTKQTELNNYAEERVLVLSRAIRELALWKRADGLCWCNTPGCHSPGCLAARAAMSVERPHG